METKPKKTFMDKIKEEKDRKRERIKISRPIEVEAINEDHKIFNIFNAKLDMDYYRQRAKLGMDYDRQLAKLDIGYNMKVRQKIKTNFKKFM